MTAFRQLWNFIGGPPVGPDLGERHRPSGYDDSYHYQSGSIAEYLEAARRQVIAARTDLDGTRDAWVIEGNSPFTLEPDRPNGRAVLMTHGLTDAPFAVRDIAGFFRDQGFYVLAMQLPGHGTRPGDLLDVRWQDWLKAHGQLLSLLQERFEQVYALGYSAGATLSLHQSILRPEIQGLFLFAPAIRLSPLARLAGLFDRAGRYSARMAWFDVMEDTDCFKYESLSNRGIAEVYAMAEATRDIGSLCERRIPVFVAASEQDGAVDSRATLDWFSGLVGPRRMLLYSSGKPALPDYAHRQSSRLPEQGICCFSHTSLLQSPENPHYGRNGSQRGCAHYYRQDRAKYERCRAGEENCLGEFHFQPPDCDVVRRLTYNPLYSGLLDELRGFLHNHCGIEGSAGDGAG